MEPVSVRPDVVAFQLDRRVNTEYAPELLRHLRRALMSLARDDAGRVDRLFSGHEPDGRSASDGRHTHVFLAADGDAEDHGAIARLIAVAPGVPIAGPDEPITRIAHSMR